MLKKILDPDLARLEVKAANADGTEAPGGILEGYASVFDNTDLGGDIVVKGAFSKTLKERLKKKFIKLYDSHMIFEGTQAVIGVVTDAKEDDYGLWFQALFSSVQRAQDIRQKIKEGVLNALSFGYDVVKFEDNSASKTRLLKELKLYEISVVPWGMNPKAEITAAKDGFPDERVVVEDEPAPPPPALPQEADASLLVKSVADYRQSLAAKNLIRDMVLQAAGIRVSK